ncbi:S-adenosyl-L-methionine-dependent methyltransferase [Podospora australis]|uniref:S-adenosyl-L-methionine-dependent methyltransferase n=1 Tax=Podospora australis TaxID=1536484 RepID=A0AAN6X3M2_9PEZI|nr:S-adenosyl-L-methionine-dependent methyltransferase [Podospora australis]
MALESFTANGTDDDGVPEVYQENRRWYGTSKRGAYMFPIDEEELERLDIFHKMFLHSRKGALFSAPLSNTETPRILDVGCGTGIWGMDVAEKFPRGNLVGVDLYRIQPEFIFENTRYQIMDVEATWKDLDPGTFDLIHMRTLNGSIANWPLIYAETYRHLKPYYGYIEHVELDFTPRSEDPSIVRDTPLEKWANDMFEVMDRFGRPLRVDSNLTKQRLADAGFVDIKEEVIAIPINAWMREPYQREIGRWYDLAMEKGYHSLSVGPFSRGFNRPLAEIAEFNDKVKTQAHKRDTRVTCNLHVFTARKPQ